MLYILHGSGQEVSSNPHAIANILIILLISIGFIIGTNLGPEQIVEIVRLATLLSVEFLSSLRHLPQTGAQPSYLEISSMCWILEFVLFAGKKTCA